MSDRPIAHHAFLCDRHSSALVATDGSVDWLAFPRFDSPSVAMDGAVDRARELFETAVAVRNDVDLLAEEYGDGELLGNVPQAFSHVGLINAAWAIAEAERTGPARRHPTEEAATAGACSPGQGSSVPSRTSSTRHSSCSRRPPPQGRSSSSRRPAVQYGGG